MPLSRRTILLGAASSVGVVSHACWRRRAPPRPRLRIVSWNLRNFSGRTTATSAHAPGHNLQRLRQHLQELDADIYCLQEVQEPTALEPLLPGFVVEASTTGGAHGQRLVIARRAGLRALEPRTHECTVVTPRMRPVLQQRFALPSGPVTIVVVHLKAGRGGHNTRREQRRALLQHLREVPAPRLVVGDFNTTGSTTLHADQEITSLAAAFATEGLHRVIPAEPCTAYWEGGRFDRFKESSTLDHVFVDRAPPLAPSVQVAPGTLCAAQHCEPIRSTDAYPNEDYERVSDHCPLRIDVSG